MTTNVAIRAFEPDDVAACLSIFDSNMPHFFAPAERPAYLDFLAAPPGPYLVLLDGQSRIVACGGYARRAASATADLCWGMVLRSLHGRGLGRLLAVTRIQRATQDPAVAEVRLDTSQHTVGFYERLGFAVLDVVEDGYAPGLHRYEMKLTVER